jgi:hypothetical protein
MCCGDCFKSGALYLKRTYARPIQMLTNLTVGLGSVLVWVLMGPAED